MARRYRLDPGLTEDETAVLRRELAAANWGQADSPDWDLYWGGDLPADSFFASLTKNQWVNHFAGVGAFGVKSELHDNVAAARRWAGDQKFPRFHPRSFSMPDDHEKWRATAAAEPDQLWLLKPKGLSRGREISLVTDLDSVPRGPKWMVQEYIQRPHLLDGLKYGLRLYILVTSLDPLLCYLHEAGVCKFTTRPYTLDPEFLPDPFVHIANTSIQQHNDEVAWSARNTDLRAYRRRLQTEGVDDRQLFDRIREAVIQMAIACREQAVMESRARTPMVQGCFELMGLDVLVDEDLMPWIVECNFGPSMGLETGYEPAASAKIQAAKDSAVADTLSVLGSSRPRTTLTDDDPETHWRQRAAFEAAGSKGFERIWPGPDADRFVSVFPLLRPLDRAVASDACAAISPAAPPIRASVVVSTHRLGDGLALHAGNPTAHLRAQRHGSRRLAWPGLRADPRRDRRRDRRRFPRASGRADRQRPVGPAGRLGPQMGLLEGFERPGEAEEPAPTDTWPTVPARRDGDLLVISIDPACADVIAGAVPTRLPVSGVRRLVLLFRRGSARAQLSAGYPAAVLDAVFRVTKGTLVPAVAGELIEWIDALDTFELDAPGGAEAEVERLLALARLDGTSV